MQSAWFWLKFVFLLLITAGVSLFSLPDSITGKLPVAMQETIEEYQIKLGIDLAGGAKLEYQVDFEEAEKKARLASSSDEEFTANFDRSEIAAGVVKTLKKRIDPDGTKEVSVFASERGEDWFVSVELTADIDTPENRAKLEKVTSLSFKEPFTDTQEASRTAQVLLDSAIENKTSFDDIAKPFVVGTEGYALNLENAFLNELTEAFQSEEIATEVFSSSVGTGWYPELIDMGSGTFALAYLDSSVAPQKREVIDSEKTFEQAGIDFPSALEKDLTISEIPSTAVTAMAEQEVGNWILADKKLIAKTGYDAVSRQSLYSVVDLSDETDETINEYVLQSVNKTEDARSVQVLYYQPRWKETALGGGQFKVAKVGTDPNTNYPVANIEFTSEGAALFAQITGELAKHTNTVCGDTGDVFAIFVDGVEVSAPCVREQIEGNAQISFGGGSLKSVQTQASELVDSLNSGATPAPVDLVSERKISASLGERALQLSIKAALIGFILVALWMLFFFRYFGFLAILALGFYALVLLFLFKFFGFVLTLSGVAGIILSIGMAVDANVLIFERIREEIRSGEKFHNAVQIGFDRAWTSIRDSNISSLITCFILFALGTSIIKAFAITLAIGIVVSMFTAITFTRYLIMGLTPQSMQENPSVLLGEKKL